MKTWVQFLLIGLAIHCSVADAFIYLETRPPAIEAIRTNGTGAIYNFQFENGNIRRMRITGYQTNPKDGSMRVSAEPADNIIVLDFESDYDVSFEPDHSLPVTSAQKNTSVDEKTSQSNRSAASGASGITIGLEMGVLAGLQAALIVGSGLNAKIDKAMARITELQKEMGDDFNAIQRARVNLEGMASKVLLNNQKARQEIDLGMGTKTLLSKEQLKIMVAQSNGSTSAIQWKSEDIQFLEEAQKIAAVLQAKVPRDSIERKFYHISKQSLIHADQQSFLGAKEEAKFLLEIAKTSADVLLGLDPFTGTARSLFEAISGENIVTGQQLTDAERTLATIGVISGGLALKGMGAFRLLENLSTRMAPHAQKAWAAVRSFFKATGNGAQLVGEIQSLRKINFRHSALDPKWGLTKIHLEKHFFGNQKYSLKNIDPKGNADKWMQEIMDLAQREPTRTLANGAIDVVGEFQRANGIGQYKLGLRLWPNQDGTYDLITVLTNQGRF